MRDPVSRGHYFLELNGVKLAENNKTVPVDLAELVFEVQEELADLNAARGQGGSAASDLNANIVARRIQLQETMDTLIGKLHALFSCLDGDQNFDHDALLNELKALLSNIAYMRTLLRDVDRELDLTHAA